MKWIFSVLVIGLIFSCHKTEDTDNHANPSETNSFNLRGNTKNLENGMAVWCMELNVPNLLSLIFSTQTLDQSLHIELWNGFVYKSECRPFLISKNCLGTPIDTLIIGERSCYYGTDSYYDPYLEIKTDRTIVIKDSSDTYAHNGFKSITAENGDLVIVPLGKPVSYVSTQVYEISMDGTFEQIDYKYLEYDL